MTISHSLQQGHNYYPTKHMDHAHLNLCSALSATSCLAIFALFLLLFLLAIFILFLFFFFFFLVFFLILSSILHLFLFHHFLDERAHAECTLLPQLVVLMQQLFMLLQW